MDLMTKKILSVIPLEKDFSSIDIAGKLYPDSVSTDSEGRVFNRATSFVSQRLRRIKGVIEIKGKHLIFWADKSVKINT